MVNWSEAEECRARRHWNYPSYRTAAGFISFEKLLHLRTSENLRWS